MRCACYMTSSRTAAYASEAAARMLFRMPLNSCISSGSSGSREVRKRFKMFALTVHPDKVPKQLQGISRVWDVFTEGFKALQQACELLMGCS